MPSAHAMDPGTRQEYNLEPTGMAAIEFSKPCPASLDPLILKDVLNACPELENLKSSILVPSFVGEKICYRGVTYQIQQARYENGINPNMTFGEYLKRNSFLALRSEKHTPLWFTCLEYFESSSKIIKEYQVYFRIELRAL